VILTKRSVPVLGIVALALIAGACSSSKKTTTAATTAVTTAAGATTAKPAVTTAAAAVTTAKPADTTAAPAVTTAKAGAAMGPLKAATLNASGATFPKAFYEAAIADFTKVNKDVKINYAGGGSGKGRTDLADQITDWAGSDGTVKDADKATFKGGEFLYFPTVVAPITVSYNADGVDKLNLTPTVIAKIFQAEITKWNDPAIAADNAGAKLPDAAIVVVHRSDGSGTTDNFTKFLDASVGAKGDGTWKLKSGSTVEWPTTTTAAEGNGGVAKAIKDTKGAIGYVDLSDAKATGLKFASIQNQAKAFIAPTLEGASAAAEGAEIKPDLTYFAGWAKGDKAYPIAAQTWIIVYKKQADKAKGEATKAFINYVLTDGQKTAKDIDFAPLPKALADKAIAQLAMIEIPA
jgi:phosphate transport system substrate-binding protein